MNTFLGRATSRCLLASSLLLAPLAHAQQQNLIEQLLNLPVIQNLMQRAPELQSLTQQCSNVGYRNLNLAACVRADQAAALGRIPHELRVVMSNPVSANSLRELCMTAAAMGRQSWLCTELGKADSQFRQQVDMQRRDSDRSEPG